MKTCLHLLALWLVTVTSALQATELPIIFARGGEKVALPVGGDGGKTVGSVALWTLGQRWGKLVAVHDKRAELVAPVVRSPLVFRMMPTDGAKVVLAELVVYPDRPVPWDKDTQFIAMGTPDWFDTWAKTVGLPVQKLKDTKTLDAGNWRMLEKPALLILGQKAAGFGAVLACRLANEHKTNVLVLESDWFGRNEAVNRDIAIVPKHMTGALADLQSQNWPLPPTFGRRVLEIANRQTWIVGPEYPLVEEIRSPEKGADSLRTVFSYLPWQQQLGRREMADELFLRVLTETAKGAKGRPPLMGRWLLLYPAAKEIKADERPVLAAALKCMERNIGDEAKSQAILASVLDLRGKASPPEDLFKETEALKRIEDRIGAESLLLILGDDPILDTWKWLELDRARHHSPRPGVVWLPDDSLPPSVDSQLRLMQLFTDWNISLENISRE